MKVAPVFVLIFSWLTFCQVSPAFAQGTFPTGVTLTINFPPPLDSDPWDLPVSIVVDPTLAPILSLPIDVTGDGTLAPIIYGDESGATLINNFPTIIDPVTAFPVPPFDGSQQLILDGGAITSSGSTLSVPEPSVVSLGALGGIVVIRQVRRRAIRQS
jgi:hypothetical protein